MDKGDIKLRKFSGIIDTRLVGEADKKRILRNRKDTSYKLRQTGKCINTKISKDFSKIVEINAECLEI